VFLLALAVIYVFAGASAASRPTSASPEQH
jgi:hypothetical protein